MNDEILERQAARLGIDHRRALSTTALARQVQNRLGEKPCCGTEERYLCRRPECRWKCFCFRLVADWRR